MKGRSLATSWLLLVMLTLGSFAMAEGVDNKHLVAALAFGIAAIKADLVMVQFMEVRAASPPWRSLYQAWLIAVTALLIGAHLWDQTPQRIATHSVAWFNSGDGQS